MFQFRRFPTYAYLIQRRLTVYCTAGFPHSEISGSKPICGSPKLIAACHVLLRLLMPRHSPCALISLTSCSFLLKEKGTKENFHSLLPGSHKNHAGFRDFLWLNCLYPLTEQLPLLRLKFHNQNLYSVACSSSIWNLQSHCSVFKVRLPTLLRSDFKA